MTVINFEKLMSFRIKEIDTNKMTRIVNKNQDVYYNESHFVRCAILELMRKYDNKGRRMQK